jgi:hypothetical protein
MSKPSVTDLEAAAVDSTAEWLAARDGRDHLYRSRNLSTRDTYRRRAAALLAGESWARAS